MMHRPHNTNFFGHRSAIALLVFFMPILAWAQNDTPAAVDTRTEINANEVLSDDVRKRYEFIGDVVLVETGPVMVTTIKAGRLIMQQDKNGYRNSVASASGEQQVTISRVGKVPEDHLFARANKVTFTGKTALWELLGDAYLKSGQYEAYGRYITYDTINARVKMASDTQKNPNSKIKQKDRVKLVIYPVDKVPPTPSDDTQQKNE